MELEDLMKFANAYNRLGWAIQGQLNDVIDGDCDDINPNALTEISRTLRGFNDDLDAAIDAAMSATTQV